MPRIFLSYSRKDFAAAQAFAEALEQAGHEVWWDHRLRAGSRFSWDIDAALKAAGAVVVLWSKDSIQSAWVQDEAAEGLEGGRLVPVSIDGTKPPLGFRQYHSINLRGWSREVDGTFDPLVAAIQVLLSGRSLSSPPQPGPSKPMGPCVCVLPFANRSGEPDQDYFSDGITEDVITDLCKVSALSVIGYKNSTPLDQTRPDLKDLVTEFGATHVLEGTVRKSASRLRISAQLIEASSGRAVWAERYDREPADVFDIQDEISHAIVEALQLTLLPREKSAIDHRGTSSAEAYDVYLKARALWSSGNAGDYRSNEAIVRLCTEATALDDGYASAWTLMALASSELRFWQGSNMDALGWAERAIALDARAAEPLCVRARCLDEQGRQAESEAAVEEALRLDPKSWEANREAGQFLFRAGEPVEAIPYLEKAVALMRTDHESASLLISCYSALGQQGAARRAAQIAVARSELLIICDPTNGSAFASAARAFAALGECDRARKWTRKALIVDPGNVAMRYSLASTLAAQLNDEQQALDVLAPFAESVRFPPHLRLLELDASWLPIREGAPFQAMLQRARNRIRATVLARR